jgi:pheromone shutdown protein TraB
MTPEEIESLKSRNELDSMMTELADYLPSVKETLIDERDQYLAAKIWTAASALAGSANTDQGEAQPRRIIAVVGAGHLQGIKTHLE